MPKGYWDISIAKLSLKSGISFRTHVLIGSVTCFAALAAMLWFISMRANHTLADELAIQAFEHRAQIAVAELDRLRDTARAGAEALAANPISDALTLESREVKIPILATILRATPGISAAYLAWPDGDFLLLRRVDADVTLLDVPESAEWMVQSIIDSAPRFEFLSASLRRIEERAGVAYALDPLTRPWFLAAQARNDTVLTSPYVFFTTREPGVTAARQAASGAIAGVDISLIDLSMRLGSLDESRRVTSALLDQNGGVLAHSSLNAAQSITEALANTVDLRNADLPPAEILEDQILTALAQQIRAGNDNFFEVDKIDGVPWFVLARPIDAQGTTLLMHASRAAFESAGDNLSRNLLLLFVATTVLALSLLWFVARQVARPVEAMADEVERVAMLDFGASTTVKSEVRELLRLGHAVSTMQSVIANYSDVLNNALRLSDHDALIRDALTRLRAIIGAERVAYWPCDRGRPGRGPLYDDVTGETRETTPFQELADKICVLESVRELAVRLPQHDDAGCLSEADMRVLAVPLRSQQGEQIGVIAMLLHPNAPSPSRSVLSLVVGVSNSIGLAIDRHRLFGQHQAVRRRGDLILAAVADGIHVLDADGRLSEQNDAAKRMLGWTVDDLQSGNSHALFHYQHSDGRPYPMEDCPIHHTLRDGETRAASGEFFFRKDGRSFPVEYECSAIRDDQGIITGAVVSFRDITARLIAERQLRGRINELDCVYRALELTLSHTRPVSEICQDIAQILTESLSSELRASARVHVEGEDHCARGWQLHETRLRTDIYSGTAVVGFVEISFDRERGKSPVNALETEAFQHAEVNVMLKAVASHVGRMIESRHLTERLTQTERLMAVGELTGGLAHDFNNLLTVVIGNTELLEERLDGSSENLEMIKMIRAAAESGAELTQRLLAFARRQPLTPRVIDVEQLLRSMTSLMNRTIGESIEINLVASPKLWQVSIDAAQLESAVLNLALNARDCMPEGGPLTIVLSNVYLDPASADWNDEVQSGPYVLVSVSDTGTGMTEETLRRAFEPFFTTKGPGRGNGLGLSMVYGFVKQSRGHIRLISTLGEGTTVKLYLPAIEAALGSAPKAREADDRHSTPTVHETILLVEDDDLVRAHAILVLEGMGYSVQAAPNAPSALEMVKKGIEFDLLFTDLVMPGGMSGNELANTIRRTHPRCAVVLTSGYSELAVVHANQLAPDSVFLRKPYRHKELVETLRQALEIRESS